MAFNLESHREGTLLRVLFRLTASTEGVSTAAFFASRGFEVEFLPTGPRVAATLRVAPYVVGDFGEAFLYVEGTLIIDEGTSFAIWSGAIKYADGTVIRDDDIARKRET